jgi:hypothetical protein
MTPTQVLQMIEGIETICPEEGMPGTNTRIPNLTAMVTRLGEFSLIGRLFSLGRFF